MTPPTQGREAIERGAKALLLARYEAIGGERFGADELWAKALPEVRDEVKRAAQAVLDALTDQDLMRLCIERGLIEVSDLRALEAPGA